MNWIDQITGATGEAESPERFQYWSAVAAMSAVIKKNVFLERYYYKLFPNVYVILVGKSGLRKGNPVTLSKNLVKGSNSGRIIAGRNTIQAIIKELGKSQSVEGGGVVKDASAFIVSGEMDSFFIKDPDAMTILTDLYDTHAHEPEWKNTTKTGGIDVLKNPCITLLGGTNEDHFKSAIAQKDVKGGFIARTLIVFENERRLINDLLDPPTSIPDIKGLSCYLKRVAKITGEFKISADARNVYRPWYKDISLKDNDDPTGTVERIGDTVLKVAMLRSLGDDLDLIIHKRHIEESIYRCTECLMGMKYVTMGGAGKESELPALTALVLKHFLICPEHTTTKNKLTAKFWGQGIDTFVLKKIMDTLIQAGAVDVHSLDGVTTYIMKQVHVDAYMKMKKKVN